MGWPKKDEGFRLYKEPKGETNGGCYLLVNMDPGSRCYDGTYEGWGEILINNNPNNPCVGIVSISPIYLQRCRRVAWEDLPPVWQKAFSYYFKGGADSPENYRGLHRIKHESAEGSK